MPATQLRDYRTPAAMTAASRDFEIFRRFDALNMLKIMSLQAELVDFENRYAVACEEERRSIRQEQRMHLRNPTTFDPNRVIPILEADNFIRIKTALKEYRRPLLNHI